MRSIAALFLLPAVALAAPAPASAEQIQITSVTTSGSGCPSGSVSTTISEDRTVLTLGFDKYQANLGVGAALHDRERDCLVLLNLKYPTGCTTSAVEATYHGFAQIDKGVTGTASSSYILSSGIATNSNSQNRFETAAFAQGQVWTEQDVVGTTVVARSKWEQSINMLVRTRLSLYSFNATASATVTRDDATIAFTKQAKCK